MLLWLHEEDEPTILATIHARTVDWEPCWEQRLLRKRSSENARRAKLRFGEEDVE